MNLLGFAWLIIAAILPLAMVCWLVGWLRATPHERPGWTAALLSMNAAAGLWGLTIPTFWVLALHFTPQRLKLQETQTLLDEGLGLVSMLWVTAFLMALTAACIWGRRANWSRRHSPAKTPAGQGLLPPRLIIGWPLTLLAFSSLLLWSLLILAMAVVGRAELLGWLGVTTIVDKLDDLALVLMVLVGMAIYWQTKPIRTILDLVLDVINYFRREAWPGGGGLLYQGRLRRDNIRFRLRKVLESIRLPSDMDATIRSELFVVAHSQGTIVALDVLADRELTPLLTGFDRRVLITMGSPFSHLYQHFFPGEYQPLTNSDRWGNLGVLLDRWVNIYRLDDYIGSEIFGQVAKADGAVIGPVNLPVDPNGHTDYWSDRQVLEILKREL